MRDYQALWQKGLPRSTELEKFVLGALLASHEALQQSVALLAEDFTVESHRLLYVHLKAIRERGEEPSAMAVHHEALQANSWEKIGGFTFLLEIEPSVKVFGLEDWIVKLQQFTLARRVVTKAAAVVESITSQPADHTNVLLQIASLSDLDNLIPERSDMLGIADIIEAGGGMNELFRARTGTLATGFPIIDEAFCGGFGPGQVGIVAARPAHGKSALMIQWAIEMAQGGSHVDIYSLEMGTRQQIHRMVANAAKVPLSAIRGGWANTEQRRTMAGTAGMLGGLPLRLNDHVEVNPAAIGRITAEAKARLGCDVIFVDYLQLCESGQHSDNRQDEVSKITRQLKRIAMRHQVCIIALSQLSRGAETEQPKLSHLRESGAIEQDADWVCALWRKPGAEEFDPHFFGILKQRDGPCGWYCCDFVGKYLRFENMRKV